MISFPPAIHAHASVNTEGFLLAVAIAGTADKVHPAGNDEAVGPKGERTRYDILPATWSRFCEQSPSKASGPLRLRVAEAILRENRAILQNRGIALTVYNLALAWKCGPNFETVSHASKDYALRVENLYGETHAP